MLPYEFKKAMVDYLISLPGMNTKDGREAFIISVGLDSQLHNQLNFDLVPGEFFPKIVSDSLAYGELADGRHALEAILLESKTRIGQNRQADCDFLVKNLREYINSNNHYGTLLKKINSLYARHGKEDDWRERYEIEKQINLAEKERSDLERRVGTFTIAHIVVKEKRPFPRISFTLVNRTGESQAIIDSIIKIQLLPGIIYFTERQSKVLTPLTTWDIGLSLLSMSDIYTFSFPPIDPIWLINDDAIAIDMRFSFKDNKESFPFDDNSSYNMQATFVTDRGLKAGSEILTL